MIASRFARRACLALALAALSAVAYAQDKPSDPQYAPSVGQPGKDVIWVPTAQSLVDRMLDLAQVTAKDYVIDLGSGDGRTVITAAKRGARALGIEYNPDMVALSQRLAAREGLGDKARFVKADIFESDFSGATVITMFLLPDLNLRLRPKILDLPPGTRVVSNSFTMGEWQHERSVSATEQEGCQTHCIAYLWIVPAKVEGAWKLPNGELTLKQSFQVVTGTLRAGGRETPVTGRLSGDEISFAAGDARYSGRVVGDVIKGTTRRGSGAAEWSATRSGGAGERERSR